MAVAIQANLVQLSVAFQRRAPGGFALHVPPIPSPGAVTVLREALVSRGELAGMSEEELLMRLHLVWGQYCQMNWLVEREDPTAWVDFGSLPDDVSLKCEAPVEAKLMEVHALTWRLQFEQRRRHDSAFAQLDGFAAKAALADRIPATACNRPLAQCSDAELLAAACQHLGMLAVLRWVTDARRRWDDPSLMEIHDQPF